MSICSRADLLLALQQASKEDWPQLAAGLDFVHQVRTGELVVQGLKAEVHIPSEFAPVAIRSKDQASPQSTPLKQYLYGISEWHAHYANQPLPPGALEAEPESEAWPELSPLQAVDYAAPSKQPPPWQALASHAQLARHTLPALFCSQRGRQVDLARMLEQVARLQLPACLPRKVQSLPPLKVWLLCERNFGSRCLWADQSHFMHYMRRKLGSAALAVVCVDDDPFYPLSLSDAGADFTAFRAWPAVLPQVMLLYCEPSRQPSQRWQEFATRFAARGVRVLWLADSRPQAKPPAPLPVAQFQSGLDLLLSLAACARRIEPELLRALRLSHPDLSHLPQLESLAWNHPDLQAGYDMALWKPASVEYWRKAFADLDISVQARVWNIFATQHAQCGRWISVQECLCLAAYAKPELQMERDADIKAAEAWLQRLLASPEASAEHAGFVLLAQQTATAFDADLALRQRFSIINRLWEIADQAKHGQPAKVRYWLRQQQGRLLLCADQGQAHLPRILPGSPMGMPLLLSHLWLEVDGQRNQVRLPESGAQVLADLNPGRRLVLGNADFHCLIEQIEADFAQECGRDEYGMYALWMVNGQEWQMRYIEAGAFWMGSTVEEHLHNDSEILHHVNISRGFWLAATTCTQNWWRAVMGANPSWFNEKKGGGDTYPVEQVSWRDVQACLHQLNHEKISDRWQVGLPTDAEWEYACRAGGYSPFWWGESISEEHANFDGGNIYERRDGGRKQVFPVQSFKTNPWGLWQMHGNLWEWCSDEYQINLRGQQFDPGLESAYTLDVATDSWRVMRGGSAGELAAYARAAYRGCGRPDKKAPNIGWRAVLRLRRQ